MWDSSLLYHIVNGIERRFEGIEHCIHIINAYDIVDNKTSIKEREIYSLFNPNEYSGVFLACNALKNLEAINAILDTLKVYDIPIVNVGSRLNNIAHVGIDVYDAMYNLVEHMVLEHNCRVFNYLGGPDRSTSAATRYAAFRDCLKDYNIKLEDDRILKLDYYYEDGIEAYKDLKSKDLHLPDVVICANDNMALGYCDAAGADGFYAPTDFKITGFDGYIQGTEYVPSLTTIAPSWDDMGYTAADIILRVPKRNAFLPAEVTSTYRLLCRQSCGCIEYKKDMRFDSLMKLRRRKKDSDTNIAFRIILKKLSHAIDYDDIENAIKSARASFQIPPLAVCLNSSLLNDTATESSSYYDDTIVCYTESTKEIFNRNEQIIPTSWESKPGNSVLMISPLYYNDMTFGYLVLPFDEKSQQLSTSHRILYINISVSLEAIRQRNALNRVNRELQYLYTHDTLTGLYNRFGFSELTPAYYREHSGKVFVITMDMNFLKDINDTYGHALGDYAIKTAAEAIKHAFNNGELCIRMGGDEFLVIGAFTDFESIHKKEYLMDEYLDERSNTENTPFRLKLSYGHSYNDKPALISEDGSVSDSSIYTLQELIRQSDAIMYNNKATYKMSLEK